MRSLLSNSLVGLLLALSVSRADSTVVRQTFPLPLASDKTSIAKDFRPSKEGTKESYTQGGFGKSIHQFAPSPIAPFRVSVLSNPDALSLHLLLQQTRFRSSFYYSLLCNKAPPTA
jgi:hypothetical protein